MVPQDEVCRVFIESKGQPDHKKEGEGYSPLITAPRLTHMPGCGIVLRGQV